LRQDGSDRTIEAHKLARGVDDRPDDRVPRPGCPAVEIAGRHAAVFVENRAVKRLELRAHPIDGQGTGADDDP
jgi:hypothetical protein